MFRILQLLTFAALNIAPSMQASEAFFLDCDSYVAVVGSLQGLPRNTVFISVIPSSYTNTAE